MGLFQEQNADFVSRTDIRRTKYTKDKRVMYGSWIYLWIDTGLVSRFSTQSYILVYSMLIKETVDSPRLPQGEALSFLLSAVSDRGFVEQSR